MNLKTPAHMVVVKKEDKEIKLRELLVAALNSAPLGGVAPTLRLLARSMNSPAVRAVIAMRSELAAFGIETRLMLTSTENAALAPFSPGSALRQLTDVRCHDAHELMVFGANTSWIGDCMRRDPVSRDSFESHSPANAQSAKWVTLSFDKFWALAHPLETAGMDAATDSMELAADLAGLPIESPSNPQVLTRH